MDKDTFLILVCQISEAKSNRFISFHWIYTILSTNQTVSVFTLSIDKNHIETFILCCQLQITTAYSKQTLFHDKCPILKFILCTFIFTWNFVPEKNEPYHWAVQSIQVRIRIPSTLRIHLLPRLFAMVWDLEVLDGCLVCCPAQDQDSWTRFSSFPPPVPFQGFALCCDV